MVLAYCVRVGDSRWRVITTGFQTLIAVDFDSPQDALETYLRNKTPDVNLLPNKS